MKELDEESAKLLKSLSDRQNVWRRNPGVVVWAFWIGKDPKKAEAWARQHEINNIIFATVSPEDPELADWNIHPLAANTHVLACRAKRAMATYTNLTTDDMDTVEEELRKLIKTRRD